MTVTTSNNSNNWKLRGLSSLERRWMRTAQAKKLENSPPVPASAKEEIAETRSETKGNSETPPASSLLARAVHVILGLAVE